MPGRLRLLALLAALAAAALPAIAAAGEFSRDRAGDVRARGLAPPQRAALDIIGLDLTKTRFLTRVVVRFKRTPNRTGVLIRLSFDNGAERTTVASVGTSPTIGAGAGGPGGTIRKGREVAVWVAGIDGNQLARVEARSFRGGQVAAPPGTTRRTRSTRCFDSPRPTRRRSGQGGPGSRWWPTASASRRWRAAWRGRARPTFRTSPLLPGSSWRSRPAPSACRSTR